MLLEMVELSIAESPVLDNAMPPPSAADWLPSTWPAAVRRQRAAVHPDTAGIRFADRALDDRKICVDGADPGIAVLSDLDPLGVNEHRRARDGTRCRKAC